MSIHSVGCDCWRCEKRRQRHAAIRVAAPQVTDAEKARITQETAQRIVAWLRERYEQTDKSAATWFADQIQEHFCPPQNEEEKHG